MYLKMKTIFIFSTLYVPTRFYLYLAWKELIYFWLFVLCSLQRRALGFDVRLIQHVFLSVKILHSRALT